MTANQVQIRRDSATNIAANTPTNGELAYDTTNKRLHVGDGVNQGGTILPNAFDNQGQKFISGTVGGTADAITLAISPAPAAYAIYQRFVFKASATNTAAATFKVNTLAAIAIKKKTDAGIADVEAGDIQQDGMYQVTYDGTYFQIESSAGGGGAILWELLSTATASASATVDLALPSGYSEFKLVIKDAYPSTSATFKLLISNDGGSTFDEANSSFYTARVGTGAPSNSSANDGFFITVNNVSNDLSSSVTALIELIVSSNSAIANCFCRHRSGANLQLFNSTGTSSMSGINYIRIDTNAGTITAGDFYLYGLKDGP